MISLTASVHAENIPQNTVVQSDGSILETAVNEAVSEYMVARQELLESGSIAKLGDIAVEGIVNDEIAHRTYLNNLDVDILSTTYSLTNVVIYNNRAFVDVLEVQRVFSTTNHLYEVAHSLTLIDDGGKLIVISDGYKEQFSGFVSCSFVDPDIENSLDINALADDSSACLLHIANLEVGYKEKASNSQLYSHTANPGTANYTKYGEWCGTNGAAWCAAFVYWCADQIDISEDVIYRSTWVPTMASFFDGQKRYNDSASMGGNYTPKPGDLFFTTNYNHIGIVYSVSNGYMTVIDGNWQPEVTKRTISLTNSGIIGYGSPNYGTSSHKWVYQSPIYRCTICGETATSIPSISSV